MSKIQRLASASFYRQALAIAVPVMLQALVQNMVSLVDNFMVAGLGDIKMSGVNITNHLLFIFLIALMTINVSGGIFMSQFNGAKNSEGMKQTFKFKFFSALALAIFTLLLFISIPQHLLGFLVNTNSQSESITAVGREYLSIILFSIIPLSFSTIMGASLREIGKVKPPLVISICAALLNTFLNWVLIYGNLGFAALEVKGAAIATVIARSLELIAFIVYLRRYKPPFYVKITEMFTVNFRLFFSILQKSGFVLFSEMAWIITETVMMALYNGRGGAEVVSGMAAGWALANLFFLVFGGIHTSIGVIVGGSLGRNELELAEKQARWMRNGAFLAGFSIAFLEALTVFLIPVVFGNLSPDARIITRNLVWAISAYMPIWIYLNAQFATARAGGDIIMGLWVDGVVNAILFLPLLFILAKFTTFGPVPLFALVKLTDFVKTAVAAWQLKKRRWVKNLAADHSTLLMEGVL